MTLFFCQPDDSKHSFLQHLSRQLNIIRYALEEHDQLVPFTKISNHCTMLLSQCKRCNQEIELKKTHCHHFLATQSFQRKYLGQNLGSVSLSLHIWRTSLQDTLNNTYITMLSICFFPSNLRSLGEKIILGRIRCEKASQVVRASVEPCVKNLLILRPS